ncbi:MAG: hypothetical protein V1769_06665 [Thermoplasmatota archaeon]
MNTKQIIEHLTSLADKKTIQQMKRFGINTEDAIGISVYQYDPMQKNWEES